MLCLPGLVFFFFFKFLTCNMFFLIIDRLQLGELKLGELLDTPPPGLDEAIAISKVIQFLESQEYSMFTRIVFDTAPTGHTLRLLSLPDFMDKSIGKILNIGD
ncbi:ATPase GET3B-like [Helianthus annuus]|uniref:ATPase GET3B-like n=1 Tax=Helianthus annuus TaxID=4232 RepID=UPI000B8F2908|nr:ATPase GET3B-like [Helianthus annuus]